jgi:short-subunit dehydrogenase
MPDPANSLAESSLMKEKYGPWALILGASYGVGADFARQVAACGIHCILLARREPALHELRDELERDHAISTRILAADLATEHAAARIADAVADLEVNLVIYNAGAPPYASEFLDAPLKDWKSLLQLNITTPMELCHLLGPRMIERGHGGLMLVGSQASLGGNKQFSIYTGSKGFMLNLGESLWMEWSDKGVDVLNLLISMVDGPTLRAQMKAAGVAGWDAEDIGVAQPADVARAGLRELGNGPTFLHPQDELTPPAGESEGDRRRAAMLERWAVTAPFVEASHD